MGGKHEGQVEGGHLVLVLLPGGVVQQVQQQFEQRAVGLGQQQQQQLQRLQLPLPVGHRRLIALVIKQHHVCKGNREDNVMDGGPGVLKVRRRQREGLTGDLQVRVEVPVREQRFRQLPQEALQQGGSIVGVKVSRLQVHVSTAGEQLLQVLLPGAVARHPEQTLHLQIWEQVTGRWWSYSSHGGGGFSPFDSLLDRKWMSW